MYNVAAAVELAWLMHYPRPSIITYDKGTEFLAEFATMITLALHTFYGGEKQWHKENCNSTVFTKNCG